MKPEQFMWALFAVGCWLVLSGRIDAENTDDAGDRIGEALSSYAVDVLDGWADGQGHTP